MSLLLRGAGCSGMEPGGEAQVAQHFGESLGSVPSQFLALSSAAVTEVLHVQEMWLGGAWSIPHPRGELNPLLLLLH